MLLRMGLAATLLVIAILVGEVAKLQTQFEMLLKALRSAGASVAAEAAAPQRDDEAAIAILIRALGSRGGGHAGEGPRQPRAHHGPGPAARPRGLGRPGGMRSGRPRAGRDAGVERRSPQLPRVLAPLEADLERVGERYLGILAGVSSRTRGLLDQTTRFAGKRLRPG